MYTVYGIPNCDTTQKTLKWLTTHKVNYIFHDYKKQKITPDKLKHWCKQAGLEKILNRKSATYREMDDGTKQSLANEKAVIKVMLKNLSLIKRPVIELNETIVAVGFDESAYEKIFSS